MSRKSYTPFSMSSSLGSPGSVPSSFKPSMKPQHSFDYTEKLDSSGDRGAGSISIMAAFRQLQTKARQTEAAREESFRVREELKRQVHDKSRRDSLQRSRLISNTSEKLVGIKAENDKIMDMNNEAEKSLKSLEGHTSAMQRDIIQRREYLTELENELATYHRKGQLLYKRNREFVNEVEAVSTRVDILNERCTNTRVSCAEALARVQETIVSLEVDLERQIINRDQLEARGHAMETYMNLLLNINNDLCEAVSAREQAEQEMKKFVIIPRYSWPKGVVQKATQVLTEAAAEHCLDMKRKKEMKKQKTFANSPPSKKAPSTPLANRSSSKLTSSTVLGSTINTLRMSGMHNTGNGKKMQSLVRERKTRSTASATSKNNKGTKKIKKTPGYMMPKSY